MRAGRGEATQGWAAARGARAWLASARSQPKQRRRSEHRVGAGSPVLSRRAPLEGGVCGVDGAGGAGGAHRRAGLAEAAIIQVRAWCAGQAHLRGGGGAEGEASRGGGVRRHSGRSACDGAFPHPTARCWPRGAPTAAAPTLVAGSERSQVVQAAPPTGAHGSHNPVPAGDGAEQGEGGRVGGGPASARKQPVRSLSNPISLPTSMRLTVQRRAQAAAGAGAGVSRQVAGSAEGTTHARTALALASGVDGVAGAALLTEAGLSGAGQARAAASLLARQALRQRWEGEGAGRGRNSVMVCLESRAQHSAGGTHCCCLASPLIHPPSSPHGPPTLPTHTHTCSPCPGRGYTAYPGGTECTRPRARTSRSPGCRTGCTLRGRHQTQSSPAGGRPEDGPTVSVKCAGACGRYAREQGGHQREGVAPGFVCVGAWCRPFSSPHDPPCCTWRRTRHRWRRPHSWRSCTACTAVQRAGRWVGVAVAVQGWRAHCRCPAPLCHLAALLRPLLLLRTSLVVESR